MTRFGTMWRRGFVLAASLALLASVAPAATFAQDEGAGEVTVMTYFSKELGEGTLQELLAQFEEESGITVNFVDVGHEDYKTGILIQLAGGNPPDAHTVWAGARTAFQVQNGSLAPIDEMWAANDLDSQFSAGMIESAVTYDGHKYLLPFGFHIAPMWYNPKVFADAGVDDPDHLGRAQGRLHDLQRSRHPAHLHGRHGPVAGAVLVRLPHPAHGRRRVPRQADGG